MDKTIEQLDYNHMADVFEKLGNWFDELPEEAEIDMWMGRSDVELPACESPASVAVWLSVYYNVGKKFWRKDRDSIAGIVAFNNGLGFKMTRREYEKDFFAGIECYMKNNPEIWGNEHGEDAFTYAGAYNEVTEDKEIEYENITPKDVAIKFKAVAKRLREAIKE